MEETSGDVAKLPSDAYNIIRDIRAVLLHPCLRRKLIVHRESRTGTVAPFRAYGKPKRNLSAFFSSDALNDAKFIRYLTTSPRLRVCYAK